MCDITGWAAIKRHRNAWAEDWAKSVITRYDGDAVEAFNNLSATDIVIEVLEVLYVMAVRQQEKKCVKE